jgi:protein-disulfide isomerase
MKNALLAIVFSFSAIFGLAACGGETSPNGSAVGDVERTAADDANKAGEIAEAKVLADDMAIGAEDAPVILIEYASVVCPACARFHNDIFPALKEEYIDTGLVRFVFREYPTEPQDFMMIGSVLARCVAERKGSEGYFFVITELFRDQRGWIYADDPKEALLRIVGQTGMNADDFDACLQRQELVTAINERTATGRQVFLVNSTPSFILNGERIRPESEADYRAAIEAALAAD